MRRALFGILTSLLLVPQGQAQVGQTGELLPVTGILRNSVTNLHAEGDTLWAGPFLNMTPGRRTNLVRCRRRFAGGPPSQRVLA